MANEVTSTTAALFIDETWSGELNRAIQFKEVIFGLFTDWTSRMPSHGNIYNLPASHNLAVATKSAGTDATAEAITEPRQQFTISLHQIVAQEIENFAEVMSKYDLRADYTFKASYTMARAREVAAAALLDDNTSQTVGVLTAELSNDNIIRAWQYLQDSAATGPFKGVVSPAAWSGLLKIDQFINALYNGDTEGRALREAQIGKVYECMFYRSNLTVGTAPNSSGHMWSGDHFVRMMRKKPTQDAWYSPLGKAWNVATDQIYGVFEVQEADEAASATSVARLHGVRLQTLK